MGSVQPGASVRLVPEDVAVGTPATFVAEVQNVDAPSYLWRRSNDSGASYTDLPGSNTNRLTLQAGNLGDHGALLLVQVWSGGALQAQAWGTLHVSATPG